MSCAHKIVKCGLYVKRGSPIQNFINIGGTVSKMKCHDDGHDSSNTLDMHSRYTQFEFRLGYWLSRHKFFLDVPQDIHRNTEAVVGKHSVIIFQILAHAQDHFSISVEACVSFIETALEK
jgi:hypothetical protein